MAIKGGCETIIHGVQVFLDVHLDWVVLKMDVTNAFNTISWRAIFQKHHTIGCHVNFSLLFGPYMFNKFPFLLATISL